LNELDRIVEEAFPGRTAEKILWTFVVTWHEVAIRLDSMPMIWKTIFLLINHLSHKPSLDNDSNVEYPGRFVFSIGSNLSDVDCNILNELGTAPFHDSPETTVTKYDCLVSVLKN
jgi:hypothetical protein